MSSSVFASRLLALGLLAMVLWIATSLIILPLATALGLGPDETAEARRLLSGYQRIAATRPQIETRLAALEAADAALTGLLPGASTELAAAGLQAEARRLIETAGGEIRSTQPLPAAADHGFDKLELQFDLTLPVPALPGLITAIESHEPALFLDKLNFQAPENSGPSIPVLTLRFNLYGYHRVAP